tara:strand:- start:4452 stop:5036 length:585 start_codon:yes stop_codon:yes gene_type:complete
MSIRQGTRIAFTGSGGTGKTTSAEFLSEALDIPFLVSAARQVYNDGSLSEDLVSDFDAEKRLELQMAIFDQKIANDLGYEYIVDRSALDHWAYCLVYCGKDLSNEQFLHYEERTRLAMLGTYSHLFYFPWGYFKPSSDGVRSTSFTHQSVIDSIIVGYAHRWHLPTIEVPQTRGEDERNNFILNYLTGGNNNEL